MMDSHHIFPGEKFGVWVKFLFNSLNKNLWNNERNAPTIKTFGNKTFIVHGTNHNTQF